MAIVSVFYAAFGYLALLVAICWGMLFVGGDVGALYRGARGAEAPLRAGFVDVALLLLPALLYLGSRMLPGVSRRLAARGLERSTQAWAAAAVLTVIYLAWRPLPHVLWSVDGSLQRVLSALFYVAWTLILIGAFLGRHLDPDDDAGRTAFTAGHAPIVARQARFTDTLRQPLRCGLLMAVWVNPVMTVGHLLLAATVTTYLLADALRAARGPAAARGSRRGSSLQGQRVAG